MARATSSLPHKALTLALLSRTNVILMFQAGLEISEPHCFLSGAFLAKKEFWSDLW